MGYILHAEFASEANITQENKNVIKDCLNYDVILRIVSLISSDSNDFVDLCYICMLCIACGMKNY